MSGRGYGDRWWEENKPADLEKTNVEAAVNAASTSNNSYTVKISLDLIKGKVYKFYFKYQHQNPDTKEVKLSDSSPIWQESFAIPNLTKAVQGLTLTAGSQSYGVKFNVDPTSIQEDVVIFESLTSDFATQNIVYTGTSTNVSILTTGPNAFAPRWVKVRSRDKWDDLNISEATAGPVTPFSADVDTTYTVANPTGPSASASIDPKDLSGFSLVSTISWTQSSDTKTAGYAIRWSTDNPSTVTNPLWEYASVSGRLTTSFTATGLIPNTTYYYQVASSTPYDVVNWVGAASGTFIASDSDGTAAGALARLRSFIAIGGVSQDLFKIGTGISQSINLNTDPLVAPPLTPGTYHGIVLNKSSTNVGNNFWLTTGQFRVGNPTEFMYWNGAGLYLTGNVNATGGKFTGNVQLAIPPGSTTSGTLFAGASATSGARVRFSSEGIFAYDSNNVQTFSLAQSTGRIDAPVGTIGGWTLATTGLSSGGATILNTGNISLGNNPQANLDSIVRLSADDPTHRLWIGSQTASNAPFRVTKEGKLHATGATIDGTTTIGGSVASTVVSNASTGATALQPGGTLTGNVTGTVNGVAVATVTSGAALGAAAIQAGNGIGIDSTSKYINTIDLNSSGIVIKTAASGTRMQLTNAGLELFNGTTRTVFIDASTGTARFAGDISGSSGTFSGNVSLVSTSTDWFNAPGVRIESKNLFGQDQKSFLYAGSLTLTNAGGNAYIMAGNSAGGINDGSLLLTTDVGQIHLFAVNQGSGVIYANRSILLGQGQTANVSFNANNLTRIFSDGTIFANSLGIYSGSGAVAIRQVQAAATGTNSEIGYLRVQSSSRKYKKNIQSLDSTGYLDVIEKLNPVTYHDRNENDDDAKAIGLIAEEVAEIPELDGALVPKDPDGNPFAINYEIVGVLAILGIKEIMLELKSIKERLDALEA